MIIHGVQCRTTDRYKRLRKKMNIDPQELNMANYRLISASINCMFDIKFDDERLFVYSQELTTGAGGDPIGIASFSPSLR
jgi:hypothetical protein